MAVQAGPEVDRMLVDRMLDGDGDAWKAFKDQYEPRLRGMANRLFGGDAEADDFVQETFLRVVKGLKDFKNGSSIWTWLFRIALNFAFCEFKKLKVRRLIEQQPESWLANLPNRKTPDPLQLFLTMEDNERLSAALEKLTKQKRAVVEMLFIKGMSYAQVAAELDIAVSTARVHAMSARRTLLSKLR